MTWDILILTQSIRRAFLEQLMSLLKSQCRNGVDIVIAQFDKEITLGENRERMRLQSHAQYISFFDDDDLPVPDYIASILPLLDGVDYIGHRVQCYLNYMEQPPTFHTLRFGMWGGDDQGSYRDISHVNPVLRTLAVQVSMEGGIGEDTRWASGMRDRELLKSEHYLDRVLYYYLWRDPKFDDIDAYDPRRLRMIQSLSQGHSIKLDHGHVPFRYPAKPIPRRCPTCRSFHIVFDNAHYTCNFCGLEWTL